MSFRARGGRGGRGGFRGGGRGRGRGGGRGGFQQDMGPPETVVGKSDNACACIDFNRVVVDIARHWQCHDISINADYHK